MKVDLWVKDLLKIHPVLRFRVGGVIDLLRRIHRRLEVFEQRPDRLGLKVDQTGSIAMSTWGKALCEGLTFRMSCQVG